MPEREFPTDLIGEALHKHLSGIRDLKFEGLHPVEETKPEALEDALLLDVLRRATMIQVEAVLGDGQDDLFVYTLLSDFNNAGSSNLDRAGQASAWIPFTPRVMTQKTLNRIDDTAKSLAKEAAKNWQLRHRTVELTQMFKYVLSQRIKDNLRKARSVKAVPGGTQSGTQEWLSVEDIEKTFQAIDAYDLDDNAKLITLLRALRIIPNVLSMEEEAHVIGNMHEAIIEASKVIKALGDEATRGYRRLVRERESTIHELMEKCRSLIDDMGEEDIVEMNEDPDFGGLTREQLESLMPLFDSELGAVDKLKAKYGESTPNIVSSYYEDELHMMRLLRAIFKPEEGQSVEFLNENQILANITWLIFLIYQSSSHHCAVKHAEEFISHIENNFYKDPSLFEEVGDEIYIAKTGPHRLSRNERKIQNAGGRLKEIIPTLWKGIQKRHEHQHIADQIGIQGILLGINAEDISETGKPPHQVSQARARQRFIVDQLTQVAELMKLTPAEPGIHYTKIPQGTYRIEERNGDPRPDNPNSKGFPNYKIYMAIPYKGTTIRMEYRLVPNDVWHNSHNNKESMTHHKNYKLKGVIRLIKLILRRTDHLNLIELAEGLGEIISLREEQEAILNNTI